MASIDIISPIFPSPNPHRNNGNSMLQFINRAPSVCVTSGVSSVFSRILVARLLSYGYSVRLTLDSQDEWDLCMREFVESWKGGKVSGVVIDLVSGSFRDLEQAFHGCEVVFHTSGFIDPHGISGYQERTVEIEERVARKVVEACSDSSSVTKCVFTSSLASCVWTSPQHSPTIIDEDCWSDERFCRLNKLWFALAKTRAEKAAWNALEELGGVEMISICPAMIPSSTHLSYLKGAKEMYRGGVLAIVDERKVAEAHIRLYEEMCRRTASGRYVVLDNVISCREDAEKLKKIVDLHSLEEEESEEHVEIRVAEIKLERMLMANKRNCHPPAYI